MGIVLLFLLLLDGFLDMGVLFFFLGILLFFLFFVVICVEMVDFFGLICLLFWFLVII